MKRTERRATSGTLAAATTNAFAVAAGAAARLEFGAQAAGVLGRRRRRDVVHVRVTDAAGNLGTTATPTIALAIATGTATSGAVRAGMLAFSFS